ncbi:hypothetical protein JD844_008540 [Phrynosoma platyrhinos]|uniref:Superkiller viralicidic activity 2-like 2 n=1 Tax=Phrynosoma platyrhinos TaxID=52577 RepID=A0ABQ7TDW9_PHRPL|nr:hypothetical protein JD844_008540 [Phrynosoma platyrhinos]
MADAFGDELFSVFEEDPSAASSSSGSKKAKGAPEAAAAPEGKAGKRSNGKSTASAKFPAKTKRDEEVDNADITVLGKKPNLTDLMPQVKVQAVETVEGCTHEVALPADEDFIALKPRTGKAAKEYPFILDAFQREAILCVDNNQSVLVSAHTSAGKTVCAEYAIAMALREKQRVIFTSPIKALSNQKYREMYEEFQDVGLMTGDVTINPTASCLVMTTEILRKRGVVWEETIILLPDNVHYVFLSATIPNARQFAEWICHLHKQPCHVIYTDYRPTPLQHYIFPAGGDGLHLVVDENGDFREDNFNTAMQVLRDAGDLAKGDQKGRKGGTKGPSNVFKIVKMIMERNFQPVIIFSFSKKDCEAYALQMTKLDFNTDEEKKMVEEALFATETFAMGINMPARTVLFTSARKFDGKDFRWITSGEYIQMSGRAGRRGMDDRGIVILMVDEKMSPTVGKQLLKGSADPLNSAFHLTYNMVLNLLRVEEINPEYMLEKSFYQFQHYRAIPGVVESSQELELRRVDVVPVLVHLLSAISSVRLYIPKDLRPLDNRQSVLKSIQEVQKRFPDGVPLLDPIDDMGIKDPGLKKIAVDIKAAKRELKKARTVLQMDELKCRKRVLRRLGFATSSDVIEMKGRVACEISSADELLLTEMMFNGLFNDLSAEQATALLSCFVFQENSSEMPKLTEQLAGPLRQMQKSSYPPDIIPPSFRSDFCLFGSIIRCMRRLEELLRQMCQAAKAIGNTELENKFAEGL